MSTYISNLGEQRIANNSHDTVHNVGGRDERVSLEVACRVGVVHACGRCSEDHAEVHNKRLDLVRQFI